MIRKYKNIVKNLSDDITPKTHLAIKRGKDIVFVPYKRGIATPTDTQIISDELRENDKLIIGFTGQTTTNKSTMRGPRM